jgi:hypothetical protein
VGTTLGKISQGTQPAWGDPQCCNLTFSFLSALVPPTFTSSQRNVTAAVGAEVRLLCRVVTAPSQTTRYWWTKNSNRIRKSSKYRPKKFRYLRIKNVDRSDAGDYVCWAKNAGGKIQQTITLNVEGKNCRRNISLID